MPDNQLVVNLLTYYAQEASITRPEIAEDLLGKTIGFTAGVHHRHEQEIGPWPKIDPVRRKNRVCQFPIGIPGTKEFHLCGNRRIGGDDLRCKAHKGKVWKVPACH